MSQTREDRLKQIKLEQIKARPYFIERDETFRHQIEVNKEDKDFLIQELERVLQMLEIAVAQLQYTQNLFKAEDLDNSVVLSMIAHEIAQIESLKK